MTSPAVKLLAGLGGGSNEPPSITSKVAEWWAEDLTEADGAGVQTWTDRVSSRQATANVETNRPTMRTNGIGGMRALDFDGSSDQLQWIGSLSTATSGCVVAVVMADTTSGTDTVWAEASSSNFRYTYGWLANGGAGIGIEQANNSSADTVRGGSHSVDTPYALEWSSSGTAWTLRINNSSQSLTVVAGSNSGDWFGDSTSNYSFSIGSALINNSYLSAFFDGKIAYLMVADAELSSGDRTALYDWISEVYGI